MSCKFGTLQQVIGARGWSEAIVCTNRNMRLKFGSKNVCPFDDKQEECPRFDAKQIPKKVEIKEPEEELECIEIRTLEDLDDLTASIREKLKDGPVEVVVKCS